MARPPEAPVEVRPSERLAVQILDLFLDWCQKNRPSATYEWHRHFCQIFAGTLPPALAAKDLKPELSGVGSSTYGGLAPADLLRHNGGMKNPETLTASEIGDYVFCDEAWRLEATGEPSANQPAREHGTVHPRHKATAERVASGSIAVGRVLIVADLLRSKKIGVPPTQDMRTFKKAPKGESYLEREIRAIAAGG